MGKTAFTNIGKAFSGVAKVGMGVFGAISQFRLAGRLVLRLQRSLNFQNPGYINL